jgi:hypothetical protein
MFSFWASPQGCRVVGFRCERLAHEGRPIATASQAKPLYSCGYEEPCRWLQCGLEGDKVNRKARVFHRFFGFLCLKCLYLLVFVLFELLKAAFGAVFERLESPARDGIEEISLARKALFFSARGPQPAAYSAHPLQARQL